jgi:arylsulfatase A-like enzyme/Tfp pilus assembly protein PilF
MNKRVVSILFAVAVTACLVTSCVSKSKSEPTAKDMNLLFITIDTCRADHIGAYGSRTAQTPVMDRLASRGVLFENCYTPVPLTLPSHCSMFTGRYPLGHRVRNNGSYFLDAGQVTLAEKMKELGYETGAVVGAFVLLSKFGLNQGFDFYDDTLDTHRIFNNYNSEITADEVYEKFSRWFEKSKRRKFFIWLHFYDPHAPYTPPQEFAAKFDHDPQGAYAGEIAFVDFTIGRLIKDLESRGILDQTLVVICGDHGEAFGEHHEFKHGIFCYQEVLKVPLVFYNPKLLPQPRSVRSRVNLVDILPTLCELFGTEVPKGVQGQSLRDLIRGTVEKTERTFYIESLCGKEEMNWAPLTGLISGGYKYISLPQPELYDLENDQAERNNLFLKKNDLAQKMDGDLMKLVANFSAPGVSSKRELTREDRERLQALGYVSSFSGKSSEVIDPKSGVLLENETRACYEEAEAGKIDEAESHLRELRIRNSGLKTPALYDAEYLILMKKNQKKEAMDVLRQARSEFPQIDRFYVLSALNAFQMHEDQEAELRCRELLKVNPLFSGAYLLLGQIAERKKNAAEAISNYRKALEIEPQNVLLKIKYAELLIAEKNFSSAMRAYNELLQNDDVRHDSELLFKIALFNVKYGTLDRAEELLGLAVQIKPNGKYLFNYALVLAKNNKAEEAAKNMQLVLSQHSSELSEDQRRLARQALQMWQQKQ